MTSPATTEASSGIWASSGAPADSARAAPPQPRVEPTATKARSGLITGDLEGMTKLVPTAEVGFLGMARDEETLDIITYAERLPEDLTDRQIFVLADFFDREFVAEA